MLSFISDPSAVQVPAGSISSISSIILPMHLSVDLSHEMMWWLYLNMEAEFSVVTIHKSQCSLSASDYVGFLHYTVNGGIFNFVEEHSSKSCSRVASTQQTNI